MNKDKNRFTEEELSIAKNVDLVWLAQELGYTPQRAGRYYTLKEMDSIRIYQRKSWFRWSQRYEKGKNGGSQIDFLRVFAGMEIKEAVFWILDRIGYKRNEPYKAKGTIPKQKTEAKKPFTLPPAAANNTFLYQYLVENRKVSKSVVDEYVRRGLIYEERNHHNIVFKGNNKQGKTLFASMRGVFDTETYSFKGDVAGNDKNYGFNVWNEESKELIVFESAIDLMSYTDIFKDLRSNKIALGMLSDAPLVTFLQEHGQIEKIKFCLDNDVHGRKATDHLMKKFYELGYEVEDCPPPRGYKDYNAWLQKTRAEPAKDEPNQERSSMKPCRC